MAGIGIGICLGISFGISGSLIFSKKISNDTTSSLSKYLSNFPYFTGFPAHSLVK